MNLRDYQKSLVHDVRNSFAKGNKRPLVVLPCGAGKTVCFADMAYKHVKRNFKENNVWFLVHRQELVDQTLNTFKSFKIPMGNVFVGMVQTLASKIKKGQIEGKPSLIIFDEAHHATAKTWESIVNYFEDVPMVGLTATPHRMNGEPLGNIFDDLVVGVDSQFLMSTGYLSRYDYYAPKIINESFSMKGSDFDQQSVAELFEKKKIYGDVKKYIDFNRKTIIYCPNIKYSKDLEKLIPGVVHFDGETPKEERRKIVEEFRDGKIKVLSNVDLIGEGFDVPDCDTVILLRPTQSLSLYIQQSMRCLRPQPNKQAIIYDLVGNVFRHGLPTEPRTWSLEEKLKTRNPSGEEDLIVRTCKKCLLAYSGVKSICPYCGNDNKKTKKQIEQEKKAELEKIEFINKKEKKIEQGKAQSLQDLIAIGKKRGYKNPQFWAKQVLKSRNKNNLKKI